MTKTNTLSLIFAVLVTAILSIAVLKLVSPVETKIMKTTVTVPVKFKGSTECEIVKTNRESAREQGFTLREYFLAQSKAAQEKAISEASSNSTQSLVDNTMSIKFAAWAKAITIPAPISC